MLSLTWTQTFFSMAAGGGVHGKGNGTARITMIRVGDTIGGVHLFIEAYPPVGGMTTGKIVGKGINGINKEYPTSKFNKTGETGKKTSTGRNKIIGVSGIRGMIESAHNSNNRETMEKEESRET